MSDDLGPRYEFWRNDLAYPHQSDRMAVTGPIDGWYRIGTNASKKHMYPVVIWRDSQDADWVIINTGQPFLLDGERGLEFQSSTWLSCEAVEQHHYDAALANGQWWDGRPSRKTQPKAEPVEMPTNNPIDTEVWEDELDAMKDAVDRLPAVITTVEQATIADSLYQRLRRLWKTVDTARSTEKTPFDEAAAKVQAKYVVPLLNPAKTAATKAKDKLDDWLRAEEQRLRVENERLRQQEAKARETLNMPAPERERPAPTAKVASGEGAKASSLRTRYVGVITDEAKFIRAISKRQDFKDFLQTTANALARAKMPTKGMEIKEER